MWQDDELITATKLNSMENGIGENNMSYQKHTWETGELITADKLNHMEDGIEGGGSAELHPQLEITFTPVGTSCRFLKSGIPMGNEIVANMQNGNLVVPQQTTVFCAENEGAISVFTVPIYEEESNTAVLNVEKLFFSKAEVQNISASNEVNCTYYDGGVVISDPTQDASISITVYFDQPS